MLILEKVSWKLNIQVASVKMYFLELSDFCSWGNWNKSILQKIMTQHYQYHNSTLSYDQFVVVHPSVDDISILRIIKSWFKNAYFPFGVQDVNFFDQNFHLETRGKHSECSPKTFDGCDLWNIWGEKSHSSSETGYKHGEAGMFQCIRNQLHKCPCILLHFG